MRRYLGLQLAEFGTKCLADENPLNWGSQLVIKGDGYRCMRRERYVSSALVFRVLKRWLMLSGYSTILFKMRGID